MMRPANRLEWVKQGSLPITPNTKVCNVLVLARTLYSVMMLNCLLVRGDLWAF
jgi:hypothetical protein